MRAKTARRFVRSLACLALLWAAPAWAQTTLVHAGRVIEDASSEPRGPATIVVTDGKIAELIDGFKEPADGDRVIDLSNRTVAPGLIDLHTHLTGDPGTDYRDRGAVFTDEWGTVLATKNSRITVLAGFTTVRDVGSRAPEIMNAIRQATAKGLLAGPRILNAGRTISIVGGNGDSARGFRAELAPALDGDNTCTGPVECARIVRLAARSRVDLIKLKITGGILSDPDGESQFTGEELRSLVETAHSLGMKVAAHAHGARAIEQAAKAGVDTIEHATFIDERAAKAMKENGTYLVPTLYAIRGELLATGKQDAEAKALSRRLIGLARKYGIPIALGTDAGVFEHGDNGKEFGLLLANGLSSQEAFSSATMVAAEALGLENEIGRIAPGYSADMIAITGNPLDDATALEGVDWVMTRGRVID